MAEDRTCLQCQSPAKLQCGRCRLVWFCSAECQRAAWKSHKDSCRLPAQPWHKLPAAERSKILSAVEAGLRDRGLDAVVALSREAEVQLTMPAEEEGDRGGQEGPRLLLLGFASTSQRAALDALRSGPLGAVTDVHEAVTFADARTPPGEAVRDACRRSWTRCHGSPAAALAAGDADRIQGAVAAAAHDGAAGAYSLRLVRRREVWVGCAGTAETGGVQLEGFAPAALREALGPFAPLAVAVEWYAGPWQGAALALRHRAGWRRDDLPELPLRLVPPPRSVGPWLEGQERLLASLDVAAAAGAAAGPPDWREGSRVLRDAPRLQAFPQFLSQAECDHLLRTALRFQQPPAEESSATAVPLPGRFTDETLEAVEARMAAAMGFEACAADPKATIVWEEKGTGQYVRRNPGGGGPRAVRGKMVVWLAAGSGGELRFPAGAWSAAPADGAPSSPRGAQRRLLAAAEAGDAILVAPRRGAAVALAVHSGDAGEEERSWYVQRAWAEQGAWTLQKLWLTGSAGP